jgi:hypothetical protein
MIHAFTGEVKSGQNHLYGNATYRELGSDEAQVPNGRAREATGSACSLNIKVSKNDPIRAYRNKPDVAAVVRGIAHMRYLLVVDK